MAHVTLAEKEHWKTRISARIDRCIETIQANHPALFDRVQREAHALALGSLGVTESYAEMEKIQTDELALARRRERVQRAMVATLRGVPLERVVDSIEIRYGQGLPLPVKVVEAIAKRQTAHREQLLAEDPIGRELARLKNERDDLLDRIWLATNAAEVRQLWIRVSSLLGEESDSLGPRRARERVAQVGGDARRGKLKPAERATDLGEIASHGLEQVGSVAPPASRAGGGCTCR